VIAVRRAGEGTRPAATPPRRRSCIGCPAASTLNSYRCTKRCDGLCRMFATAQWKT
jgi:hypothetical protein